MRIETTRFGTIDVSEANVYRFPDGLPGFDAVRSYCLIDHPTSPAFQWLQATQVPGLAFVVTNPLHFKPDYRVHIHPEDASGIQLEDVSRAVVLVILVVPRENPMGMTANLQAPLVFNVEKRLARQLVLAGNQYPLKYPVFGNRTTDVGTATAAGGDRA